VNRESEDIRVDKYLWAVRVFKTRSQSTDACRKGKVIIDDIQVKPSRVVKEGDVILVKRKPVVYSYRVKKLLGKRLSAKLVVDYVENITPEEELKKLEVKETFFIKRDRGAGRPTKKERRIIDKLREP
jgi:ribosome-associated heat shock protein Hsp15